MRRKQAAILILALTVSLPLTALAVGTSRGSDRHMAQTTVTLNALDDATVRSWQPGSNFGEQDDLEISYEYIDDETVLQAASLLRFDIGPLPSDAVVDTAELRLYLTGASGPDPVTIAATFVTGPWDETGVTWDAQPTTSAYGVNADIDATTGSYKSWAIPSFVQSWIDDPSSNHGVLLSGPTSGDKCERWFESLDHMEQVPQLVVTYHKRPFTFSGHVYEGEPDDTTNPSAGVTVALWGDEDASPDEGFDRVSLDSASTAADGAFDLEWQQDTEWPYLHVIEVDPAGSDSTGARAELPGEVTNANCVTYGLDELLASGTHNLGGIGFWDQTIETEPPPPEETDEWVVNTTADSDDGACQPLNSGDCTLREAINAANASEQPKRIDFQIPDTGPGFKDGAWTIRPESALPDVTCEGLQIGVCGGGPPIVLNGEQAPSGASGLTLRGVDLSVRGIAFTRWPGDGLHVTGPGADRNAVVCSEMVDNLGDGVLIDDGASHTTVGGELGANWIAGNGGDGVRIAGTGTDANEVAGNVIGADRAGVAARPNMGHGVRISAGAQSNAVGGELPDEQNVIAGNVHSGVVIEGQGTDANAVTNNLIGIAADGRTGLPNGHHGVGIYSGASGNQIGTSGGGANVIGANAWSGVAIVGSAANAVVGNYIGIAAGPSANLANGSHGVQLVSSADNDISSNTIAHKGADGVRVEGQAALRNTVSVNAITDNGGGGIRLVSGGNGELLPPSVTSVTRDGVSGTACPGCTVEVFSDPKDEGAYVHSPPSATADGSGNWSWSGSVTGANVTATATDGSGSTSEFGSEGWFFSGHVSLAAGTGALQVQPNPGPTARTGPAGPATPLSLPVPIPKPVQVVLYGSSDPAEIGEPLLSVSTGPDGRFVMACKGGGCVRPLPFFNLVVDDPGFVVERAESRSGGRVTDEGWIQFEMNGTRLFGSSDVCFDGPFPDNDFVIRSIPLLQPDVVLEPVVQITDMPSWSGPVGTYHEVDFRIAGIEVTQAIQCYSDKDSATHITGCSEDNELPLAAAKPTVVRVDVDAGTCGSPESRGPVRVDLSVSSDTDSYTTHTYLNAVCASSAARREHAVATANFYLQKPEAGAVSVWAEVNGDQTRAEPDYTNNRYPAAGSVDLEFDTREPLSIGYYLVDYRPSESYWHGLYDGPSNPSLQWAASRSAYELVEAIYPTAPIDYFGLATSWLPWIQRPDVRHDPGESLLLGELYTRWAQLSLLAPHPPSQVFAWLPTGAMEPIVPDGSSDWQHGRSAYGEEKLTDVLAHQLGHNLGLEDAPSGWTPPLGTVDPAWPYSDGRIQEVGFDVADQSAVASSAWDLMSYREPTWISPYHWRKLYEALAPSTAAGTAARSAPESYALVRGLIGDDDTGTVDPLLVLSSEAQPPAAPAGGDYCLRFYGAGDALLSSHCFDPAFTTADPEASEKSAYFAYLLPYPGGAARLALVHSGTVLDARTASANPPQIAIQSPTTSTTWSGIRNVAWTADDDDADELTFAVHYSHDGGQTWTPVVADLTDTSYRLDTTSLPGGDQIVIRVWVSDGFHTASADSPVLSVPDKAPTALITEPGEGRIVSPSKALLLEGSARDPEEGSMTGRALSWWSARDGLLGRGKSVMVPGLTLSLGRHRLTLKATDDDGQTGEAYVMLEVGYRVYMPVLLRSQD